MRHLSRAEEVQAEREKQNKADVKTYTIRERSKGAQTDRQRIMDKSGDKQREGPNGIYNRNAIAVPNSLTNQNFEALSLCHTTMFSRSVFTQVDNLWIISQYINSFA